METEVIEQEIGFEIREANDEEHTVEGIAIPYGEDSTGVAGYTERISAGAFKDATIGTPVYWNHEHVGADGKPFSNRAAKPVGSISEITDSENGLKIKVRLAKTSAGQEVYGLVKDKHLTGFSATFTPTKSRMVDGKVVRDSGKLNEVSIVPKGAYKSALISQVREDSATNNKEDITENMSNENEVVNAPNEVAVVREEMNAGFADLDRKIAGLAVPAAQEVDEGPQFRSFGDYAKAVVLGQGVDNADAVYRAYTGGTSADSVFKATWAQDAIRLIDKGRPVTNFFGTKPLPAEGTTVSHGVLNTNTLTAGVQVSEGTNLATGKVALTTKSATVYTIGGASVMSRQEIERGNADFVDLAFRGMAIEYAKAFETRVVSTLTGGSGYGTATLSANTFAGWAGLVIDAEDALDDSGLTADALIVSSNIFKKMAVLVDGSGRPLLDFTNSGVNSIGSADLTVSTARFLGVPVLKVRALADNSAYFANRQALQVWESSGAPFRLADQDILALTNTYSVYGYEAAGVEIPGGIVTATVTAS